MQSSAHIVHNMYITENSISLSQDTAALKLIAFEARSRVSKNACFICHVCLSVRMYHCSSH